MPEWRILVAILALGFVSYALRSGGFLAAGLMREEGRIAKFLRLAPANLFIAFITAACVEGGWPSVVGCTAALASMALTRKDWLALTASFSTAAVAAKFLQGP